MYGYFRWFPDGLLGVGFLLLNRPNYLNCFTFQRTSIERYVLTFLRSYVLTFLRSYALTLLRSYVLTFLRSYVLTFLRSYVLTFLRSYAAYIRMTVQSAYHFTLGRPVHSNSN